MCGRTACTLNPDDISRSCRYRGRNGARKNAKWANGKDKYYPSHNKAPQSYCPILLNGSHFKNPRDQNCNVSEDDEVVLSGMRWGLIPNWFKGENIDKVNYSMNNARSDTMLEKRSYKVPLRKGQRCVVLAEGFYEWNTKPDGKQPYYIYFPNRKEEVCEEDCDDSKPAKRLVTMAGIFEKTFHNDEDLYSFTVVTVDAHPTFAWLHHRMPAMLTSEEEVETWLDYENVPLEKALELIKPKDCLQWHPVSKFVNNSRNNGPECWEEVDLTKVETKSGKYKTEQKSMMKWLASGGSPKKTNSPQSSAKKKHSLAGAMDKFITKKPKLEEGV